MTATANQTTYRLSTAKGTFFGSLSDCVAEQRELCGSFAEIASVRRNDNDTVSVIAEVSVDDDHIDWSEDDDGVVAQVEHALSITD